MMISCKIVFSCYLCYAHPVRCLQTSIDNVIASCCKYLIQPGEYALYSIYLSIYPSNVSTSSSACSTGSLSIPMPSVHIHISCILLPSPEISPCMCHLIVNTFPTNFHIFNPPILKQKHVKNAANPNKVKASPAPRAPRSKSCLNPQPRTPISLPPQPIHAMPCDTINATQHPTNQTEPSQPNPQDSLRETKDKLWV